VRGTRKYHASTKCASCSTNRSRNRSHLGQPQLAIPTNSADSKTITAAAGVALLARSPLHQAPYTPNGPEGQMQHNSMFGSRDCSVRRRLWLFVGRGRNIVVGIVDHPGPESVAAVLLLRWRQSSSVCGWVVDLRAERYDLFGWAGGEAAAMRVTVEQRSANIPAPRLPSGRERSST